MENISLLNACNVLIKLELKGIGGDVPEKTNLFNVRYNNTGV